MAETGGSTGGRARWRALGIYQKFEHAVLMFLTALIAVVIVAAVWNLTLKIVFSLVIAEQFDPTEHTVFQTVFGMIFTVIIALEFKRSLLIVVTERYNSIVQVRTVVLLAMLAMVRKLIILDFATTDALHLFALAAAMAALGGVYWSVREQDRRDRPATG